MYIIETFILAEQDRRVPAVTLIRQESYGLAAEGNILETIQYSSHTSMK